MGGHLPLGLGGAWSNLEYFFTTEGAEPISSHLFKELGFGGQLLTDFGGHLTLTGTLLLSQTGISSAGIGLVVNLGTGQLDLEFIFLSSILELKLSVSSLVDGSFGGLGQTLCFSDKRSDFLISGTSTGFFSIFLGGGQTGLGSSSSGSSSTSSRYFS